MVYLSPSQRAAMQVKITNGDIAGFYADVESAGDPYGRLGGDVTANSGWQGEMANKFVESEGRRTDKDLSYGSPDWVALNSDLAQRYLDAYNNNSGNTPTRAQVQNAHTQAYSAEAINPDGWLPNKPLNDAADPDALWNDYLSNSGPADLWGDAFGVAAAGAAMALNPWAFIESINDPDFLEQVRFADNFYNALAQLSESAMDGMIGDFTGNGAITDLLDFIASLPGALAGLLGKLPDAFDGVLPNGLPDWLPGVTLPWGDGEDQISPIVLDIDASGTIELAAFNGAGSVYWDIDNDGFREASGWITGGDGLLCVDLNSDGVITHNELLGNDATYANGYDKLDALYDTDNDNAITSADTDFGDFLVWVDANADGHSQSGELHSLTSLGITSITTTYSGGYYQIAGNDIWQESTFEMNGNTYASVDAWFTYDDVNSEYVGNYTLDLRTLFLPDLRGHGTLTDLHIAMSLDEDLLDMVHALATAYSTASLSDLRSLQEDFRDMLYRWAGADGVTPGSRGDVFDARELAFLEAFMGDSFEQVGSTDPWENASVFLQQSWDAAFNGLFGDLLCQVDMGGLFNAQPIYNPLTGVREGHFSLSFDHIASLLAGVNGGAADPERMEEVAALFRIIDATIGFENLSTSYRDALDAIGEGSDLYQVFNTDAFDFYFNQDENFSPTGNGSNNIIIANIDGGDIYAGDGNDAIYGGVSADFIYGEDGNDLLIGGDGGDGFYGGLGNDTYYLQLGDSYQFGGTETITESANEGFDTISLGEGINPEDIRFWITTGGVGQLLFGVDDYISISGYTNGTTGAAEFPIERFKFHDGTIWDFGLGLRMRSDDNPGDIIGSALSDHITGGTGAMSINGYGGNDTIIAGSGNDFLYGGDGDDLLIGGAGNDALDGEGGIDTASFADAAGAVTINLTIATSQDTVGAGVDTFSSIENIIASGFNDSITGNSSANIIEGGAGNDTLVGGGGTDTVSYEHAGAGVTFNLATSSGQNTVGAGTDTVSQFENVRASAYGDTITGDGNANILSGLAGNDTLSGGNGNDTLEGGDGNDTITGGNNTDTVTYANASAGGKR